MFKAIKNTKSNAHYDVYDHSGHRVVGIGDADAHGAWVVGRGKTAQAAMEDADAQQEHEYRVMTGKPVITRLGKKWQALLDLEAFDPEI